MESPAVNILHVKLRCIFGKDPYSKMHESAKINTQNVTLL